MHLIIQNIILVTYIDIKYFFYELKKKLFTFLFLNVQH